MSAAGVTLATLAAVLGASVVGSLHCVGMCGGFAAVVAGERELGPTAAYHATRGLTYTSLGLAAGSLGAGLDHGGSLVGVQTVAGPLMGVVLVVLAARTLWSGAREGAELVELRKSNKPGVFARARLRLARAIRERGASAGAAAGLLTALLPCGWLWSYLALATATGRPMAGAAVMLVFWLGTVPALLGAGWLAGELGRRLGRHAPKIAALALLALGLLSLFGKLTPPVAEPTLPEAASEAASGTDGATPVELPKDAPCH